MIEIRKFGPKQPDHWSVGKLCPYCMKPFKEGDYTTLVPVEAGFASPEDQEKAMQGRAYNTEAEEVHYDCAVAKK